MDTAGVLLENFIFHDLERRDVLALLPSVRTLRFAGGDVLWSEGEPATALHVIAEGRVKSHRADPNGGELILELASAGDAVGEVSLFHPGGVRLVSVTAIEPTLSIAIAREPLLSFMVEHPAVMRRMLEAICEIAGRATRAGGIVLEDVRRRVARTLLDLAREHGDPAGQGFRIRLKLSQSTLAAMIAASRENVDRALSLLASRGAVSQNDGFFFVHDPKTLEVEAGVPL